MTRIVQLVERKTAFDPEEVVVLVDAFNEAWARLRASGSECTRPAYSRAMQEVVARRIVDAARRGTNGAEEIAAEAASFIAVNYRHS
jgi:predicted secreted protein